RGIPGNQSLVPLLRAHTLQQRTGISTAMHRNRWPGRGPAYRRRLDPAGSDQLVARVGGSRDYSCDYLVRVISSPHLTRASTLEVSRLSMRTDISPTQPTYRSFVLEIRSRLAGIE